VLIRIALALAARFGVRAFLIPVIPVALAIATRPRARKRRARTLDAGSELHTGKKLEAGSELQVRLLDPVSSRPEMRGKSVRALVIAPAPSDTAPLVIPHTVLRGTITEIGEDRRNERRRFITLAFTSIEIPGRSEAPISARVSAVDNAQEWVDTAGRIIGLPDPSLVRSRADWALFALGTVQPEAAAALLAVDRGELYERHRTIDFPPGVEMQLTLTASATLPDPPVWHEPPALASAGRLDSLLQSLPPRTYAFGDRKPADLINLVFIGSEADLHAAFLSAGWETAERLCVRTCFDTFVDMAEARGYRHQPVSQLLLDDCPPDMVFQKLTDTFAKRHHIRIWRWPTEWQGRAIFLAAATHDVGIEFLPKEHTFTHRVDPRIDLERDKVVNDLITAGELQALSFVRRPPIAGVTMNREQNPMVTDWRVAIASLGSSQ
jgi:hypothetical protein